MSAENAICPDCQGHRQVVGLGCGPDGCRPMALPCSQCRGTGEIPSEQLAWIKAGAQLRQARLARDMSLREEARRLGIRASDLSDCEHGRRDPRDWPVNVRM